MITLHSLDQSRALRIVWLLEILGTPYRLQTYRRHPDTLLAPEELKAIHPLGKSPLLDDDGFILAESGAITDYLIQTYGNGLLMPERGSREYWQYQRWLHYAEGSLMPLLLLGLVFRRIESVPMPFFRQTDCPQISGSVKSSFIHPQAALHLAPHQQRVGKPRMVSRQQPKRCRHHDELSAANRGRPLRFCRLPQLSAAYLQRIEAHEAYRRAVEKAGSPY